MELIETIGRRGKCYAATDTVMPSAPSMEHIRRHTDVVLIEHYNTLGIDLSNI